MRATSIAYAAAKQLALSIRELPVLRRPEHRRQLAVLELAGARRAEHRRRVRADRPETRLGDLAAPLSSDDASTSFRKAWADRGRRCR